MNKIIIGGRACSGKDTIADYLVEKYGYTKLFFAEGIYEIAYKYFGMTSKDRTLLQKIGEKLREIDPDIWVKFTFNKAKNINKVVISDCRRLNEYEYAIKNGFVPIRIHAKLETRIQRCIERDGKYPNIEEWENESETGADNCKFTEFYNDGTKEKLFEQIDKFLGIK